MIFVLFITFGAFKNEPDEIICPFKYIEMVSSHQE